LFNLAKATGTCPAPVAETLKELEGDAHR
jgi:hypothetical protein